MTPGEEERVLALAQQVAARAYAPYSRICIGAAVLTEAGGLHAGCNVENASYGLSQCAERAAVTAAVAAEGAAVRIRVLAVWTKDLDECSPCGACRQVIAELGPDALVLCVTPKARTATSIHLLLPGPFGLPEVRQG